MESAAKSRFEPILTNAAERMNGCFQHRAKTFDNRLGFEQGSWQRKAI